MSRIFVCVGGELRTTRLRPRYVQMALGRGAKRPSKPPSPLNAQNILHKNAIVDFARGVENVNIRNPIPQSSGPPPLMAHSLNTINKYNK